MQTHHGGFQVGNKDRLEVETFLTLFLRRGPLPLQPLASSHHGEHSHPVSLQPPSPPGGFQKEAACAAAMMLFLLVWKTDDTI